MRIHELTDAECREFLEHTNLARLACSHGDQPYIVPIYFDFDGEALYSFSMHGRKIEWMRSNPSVCVEIDEIVGQFDWTTVVVFGRYEELRDTPDHETLRDRAAQLFRQRPEWWLPAAADRGPSQDRHQEPVVFRIRVTSVHGRRAIRDETAAAVAARPVKRASASAPWWWIQVLRAKGRD